MQDQQLKQKQQIQALYNQQPQQPAFPAQFNQPNPQAAFGASPFAAQPAQPVFNQQPFGAPAMQQQQMFAGQQQQPFQSATPQQQMFQQQPTMNSQFAQPQQNPSPFATNDPFATNGFAQPNAFQTAPQAQPAAAPVTNPFSGGGVLQPQAPPQPAPRSSVGQQQPNLFSDLNPLPGTNAGVGKDQFFSDVKNPPKPTMNQMFAPQNDGAIHNSNDPFDFLTDSLVDMPKFDKNQNRHSMFAGGSQDSILSQYSQPMTGQNRSSMQHLIHRSSFNPEPRTPSVIENEISIDEHDWLSSVPVNVRGNTDSDSMSEKPNMRHSIHGFTNHMSSIAEDNLYEQRNRQSMFPLMNRDSIMPNPRSESIHGESHTNVMNWLSNSDSLTSTSIAEQTEANSSNERDLFGATDFSAECVTTKSTSNVSVQQQPVTQQTTTPQSYDWLNQMMGSVPTQAPAQAPVNPNLSPAVGLIAPPPPVTRNRPSSHTQAQFS